MPLTFIIFLLLPLRLQAMSLPVDTSATVLPAAATPQPAPLPAFPTAEGFGAQAVGGRGGRIIYVSKLTDTGEPGTLRYALEALGPRIVLFRVSGSIRLQHDISISSPFLTVAGQSAPGEGVQIRGGMIQIRTHDVVLRYLKMRPGDEPAARERHCDNTCRNPVEVDGIKDRDVYNVILDHCTMIWGPDTGGPEVTSNSHHITIQWSILGEGLFYSNHAEGVAPWGHSKGVRISQMKPQYSDKWPQYITLHHNLITTSDDRNPLLHGVEFVDMVNNVVYNWGVTPAEGSPRSLNLIKNFFIKGPMTRTLLAWKPSTSRTIPTLFSNAVYEEGTLTEGFATVRGGRSSVYTTTRFAPYSMGAEHTPRQAYDLIVRDVGANRPARDATDQRILNNLLHRTGEFVNGVKFGLTWPDLASGPVPGDVDQDGMPEQWEQLHFGTTKRGSPSDSRSDFDADGYTDVEEYLNLTDPKVPDTRLARLTARATSSRASGLSSGLCHFLFGSLPLSRSSSFLEELLPIVRLLPWRETPIQSPAEAI